ncbi:MAG: FHA domain-containing protein [Planctomycetaceae bacterium]
MNVFLELTSGRASPTRVRLKPQTVIGRSKQCQLRIASTEVSREHCQISLEEEGAFLVDLGSSNGTVVDGKAAKPGQRIQLASGSRLQIGPAQFIVHIEHFAARTIDNESTVDRPSNNPVPVNSPPFAPALTDAHRRNSVADDGDSFLAVDNAPMNDTALMNPGQMPMRLAPVIRQDLADTAANSAHATWPGLPGAAVPADASPTLADRPAIDHPEETSSAKPSKLFSLFSLLTRSGAKADAPPHQSAEVQPLPTRQEEIAPGDHDDVEIVNADEQSQEAVHDDLSHFLKGLP